jgi:hypothetical protein
VETVVQQVRQATLVELETQALMEMVVLEEALVTPEHPVIQERVEVAVEAEEAPLDLFLRAQEFLGHQEAQETPTVERQATVVQVLTRHHQL